MSRSAKNLQQSNLIFQIGIGLVLVLISLFVQQDRTKAYLLFGGIILIFAALVYSKGEMIFKPPLSGNMPFKDKNIIKYFRKRYIDSISLRFSHEKYDAFVTERYRSMDLIPDIDHDEINVIADNSNSVFSFGNLTKRYPIEYLRDDLLVILHEDLGYPAFFDVEIKRLGGDKSYKYRYEAVLYTLKYKNNELGLNDEILYKVVNEVCELHHEVRQALIYG